MRKKLLYLAILSLAVIGISFIAESNFAQNRTSAQTLEVTPVTQEISADPGQTVTLKTTVRNRSDNNVPVVARVENFTAVGEEGQIELVEEGPWSISTWTTLSPKEFTLDPGQEQEVEATIRVPDQNTGGGRYGSFVFAIQGKGDANSAGVSQEIASLFLIKVNGPVSENLQLLEFQAPNFAEFGPIPLEMKFRNEGNVHVKVQGVINVTNMFGKKVQDVVIPPTNVFPGANRVVTAEFSKKFLFGPYQALAIVYYGESNQSITEYVPFFVFPVRIVAVVIIIFVLLYLSRKRISKAMKALMGK